MGVDGVGYRIDCIAEKNHKLDELHYALLSMDVGIYRRKTSESPASLPY
jgi:hypothetical protein